MNIHTLVSDPLGRLDVGTLSVTAKAEHVINQGLCAANKSLNEQ